MLPCNDIPTIHFKVRSSQVLKEMVYLKGWFEKIDEITCWSKKFANFELYNYSSPDAEAEILFTKQ